MFSGSLGLWWSNNCRSKSGPLPLRGLPSRSRFSASPDWSQKPLVLPDPPTRLPSPQAGAQLPAPRLASCAPSSSSPTWGRTSPASWTGPQKKQSSFTEWEMATMLTHLLLRSLPMLVLRSAHLTPLQCDFQLSSTAQARPLSLWQMCAAASRLWPSGAKLVNSASQSLINYHQLWDGTIGQRLCPPLVK